MAQNFRFHPVPTDKLQIGTRFMHQIFHEDNDALSVFTGIYEYSINAPMFKHANFLGAFPVTYYKEENEDAEYGIGNLYLAIQTGKHFEDSVKAEDRYTSSATFGIYLPVASEEDIFSRFSISYLIDRYEYYKYMPDFFTFYTNYTINIQPHRVYFLDLKRDRII